MSCGSGRAEGVFSSRSKGDGILAWSPATRLRCGSGRGRSVNHLKLRLNGVEAPGIEPRVTSVANVANRRQNDADRATQHDSRQREVSASTPRGTDEAIRMAAKLAIDAEDLTRAHALLDLLDIEPRTAPRRFLAGRKPPR